MLPKLLGLNKSELRALVQQEDEPMYRGNQLAEWIYKRGVRTIDEMTNLPDTLRLKLKKKYDVGRSQLVTAQHGRDGTFKLLLAMYDGAKVETVGLPYTNRFSCCLSTQVGCPMECMFCATGISGYTRNLSAGEIVDQLLTTQEEVQNHPRHNTSRNYRVGHVTFMGMGEPLLNFKETLKAIRLLNEELSIAMRHLTLSTAGYVPGIRKLMKEKLQITLAISLHAPDDVLRRQLMPKMIKWDIGEVIAACREYIDQTGRRVTFEYCLLGGVNDGTVEAHELARLLHGLNCHVNLIPYNPVRGISFRGPSVQSIRSFREIMESKSIQVTMRVQRGSDIDAACGQLRQSTMRISTGQQPQ